MFTSFNSLAVYTAHSLQEQGALREVFEKNGLEYSVSIKNPLAPEGFFPAITPDMLLSESVEYIFLVYKKDWEKAAAILKDQWHWEENEP